MEKQKANNEESNYFLFVFVNGFSVRGTKTILTCFSLYCTAGSSQYLMSKFRQLLLLLLMLINLLPQTSTDPHQSLSAYHPATRTTHTSCSLNCSGLHPLLFSWRKHKMIQRVTLSVIFQSGRKEKARMWLWEMKI